MNIGWKKRQHGKTTTSRGYGHAWAKLRKKVIQRDSGLCQEHYRNKKIVAGSTVDHILNKASGGTDEMRNLELLCNECHKAKTQTEAGRGRENLYSSKAS